MVNGEIFNQHIGEVLWFWVKGGKKLLGEVVGFDEGLLMLKNATIRMSGKTFSGLTRTLTPEQIIYFHPEPRD